MGEMVPASYLVSLILYLHSLVLWLNILLHQEHMMVRRESLPSYHHVLLATPDCLSGKN